MPKGEVFFRKPGSDWKDVFTEYGISFTESSLSRLMTPAPNKEAIENKSRLQNGKRVIRKTTYVKKDERSVDLEMHIYAHDSSTFWSRFESFCDYFLDNGFFDIRHSHAPSKVFRMTYQSCSQFSEYAEQLAKFTLRLNEPDPTNRGETDKWASET